MSKLDSLLASTQSLDIGFSAVNSWTWVQSGYQVFSTTSLGLVQTKDNVLIGLEQHVKNGNNVSLM